MTGPPRGDAMNLPDELRFCYDLGWSFTPLRGKIPRQHGWQRAPRPLWESILQWLRSGHNLGLRTGQVSGGVGVVDIDNGADVTGLDLPPTVQVRTGSGGTHLYYLADAPLRNSVGKIAPHVDFRGDGGQVVFPGSIHPDTKKPYTFTRAPWEIALAPLPVWIKERLTPPPPRARTPISLKINGASAYARAALAGEVTIVSSAKEHTRNHTLYLAAFKLGGLVAAGVLAERAARDALAGAAQAAGLPEDEAAKTITSGLAAGVTRPRAILESTR